MEKLGKHRGAGKVMVAAMAQKSSSETDFGKMLRGEREKRGIGLRQLASKVGITSAYLSYIERGQFPPPSEEKLKLIAHELSLDADRLLAAAGKISPDLVQIIRRHPRSYAALLRSTQNFAEGDFDVLIGALARAVGTDEPAAQPLVALKAEWKQSIPIDWAVLVHWKEKRAGSRSVNESNAPDASSDLLNPPRAFSFEDPG